MKFFKHEGGNGHPPTGAEHGGDLPWPVTQEGRSLLAQDISGWPVDSFRGLPERWGSKGMRKRFEAGREAYELGTRFLEAKQRFELTALETRIGLHLRNLEAEATTLEAEAALLSRVERAREQLRQVKLAKLASELGVPLTDLERLFAAQRAKKNGGGENTEEDF